MMTIALCGKKAAGRGVQVDDTDYELVAGHRWRVIEKRLPSGLMAGPYAMAAVFDAGQRADILMHTLITGWPMVDHRDHDGLNNQRSNLRPATVAQNMHNRRKGSGSSRYKGVSRYRGKWMARIGVNGGRHYLGLFVGEEGAALAYNAAALELFGEYACLNQIAEAA